MSWMISLVEAIPESIKIFTGELVIVFGCILLVRYVFKKEEDPLIPKWRVKINRS